MRNPQCSGKKALCSPRSLGCLINITALNRMFGGHWMEWTPFGVGCREFWNLCWEWLEIPGLFPSWINSVSLSFSLPYYEGGTDFQDLAKLKKKKKTHTARAGLYFLFVSESLELGLRRWDCGGAQTNLCYQWAESGGEKPCLTNLSFHSQALVFGFSHLLSQCCAPLGVHFLLPFHLSSITEGLRSQKWLRNL